MLRLQQFIRRSYHHLQNDIAVKYGRQSRLCSGSVLNTHLIIPRTANGINAITATTTLLTAVTVLTQLSSSSSSSSTYTNTYCEANNNNNNNETKEEEQQYTSEVEILDEEDWSDLPPESEEEEESCPLCKFMKAGPCGNHFRRWQLCVDQHREGGDFAEKCVAQTLSLGKCSELNQLGLFDMVGDNDDSDGDGNGDGASSSNAASVASREGLPVNETTEQGEAGTAGSSSLSSSSAEPSTVSVVGSINTNADDVNDEAIIRSPQPPIAVTSGT